MIPDSALLRAHGSLNMSSIWLVCGSKEELALTQECGPIKALAFCCRRYSRHAGVASSAYVYHHWRGFGRLALFIYRDDFMIPDRLALVGDFPLTRRVTVPLTHEQ